MKDDETGNDEQAPAPPPPSEPEQGERPTWGHGETSDRAEQPRDDTER